MSEKPTYEELELRVRTLEEAESTFKRTNEGLDDSELWFRSILETINEGVILQAASGEILAWNKRAEHYFGLTRIQSAGNKQSDMNLPLIHEDGSKCKNKDHPFTKTLQTVKPCVDQIMGVYRTPDDLRWISINTNPLFRNKEEKPYAVIITFSDITELKIEKDNAQNYLDVAGVIILALDRNGDITLINRKGCEILGQPEGDIIGTNWLNCFTPKDKIEEANNIYNDLMEGRIDPVGYTEIKIITKSGSEKLMAWHNTLLKDKDSRIIGSLSSGEDITEKKKAVENLRESERHHRTIIQTAMDGFHLLDKQDNILEVNDAYCKMSGYSREELLRMKILDLEVVESQDDIDKINKTLVENLQRRFVSQHRRKDGSLFDVEISVRYLPEEEKFVYFLRDITEQKKAEEALRDREELLNRSQEMASVGSFVWDLRNSSLTWSRNMYAIHGTTMESYKGDVIDLSNKLIHPDDIGRIREDIKKILKANNEWDVEFRLVLPDGNEKNIRSIGKQEYDDEGVASKCFGVYQDITGRRQAEKMQEKLQMQLSTAIEIAGLGPWEYDVERDLFTFNDYFYKIYGTSVDEVGGYEMSSGEYAKRFVHQDDIPFVVEEMQKAVRLDEIDLSKQLEHRIIYTDNTIGHITVRLFIVRDKNGTAIKTIGVNQNITERKRAEQRLRESEEKLIRAKKMESLGLLAGGVAHDLNNVLSGIVSYPELLLLNLPEDNKYRKPIQTIQDSGMRAVAIVQDLLTIARGVATPKESLNLNNIINEYKASPEYAKLIQYHPTVTVKTDLNKDLMNISGSLIHIRKLIMNLVSNASEAIEGSGNVVVSTMNRYVDRPIRGYDDVKIGEYAVLKVTDDGSGILKEHMEKIFEPFFTKKVMGRSGTGLGLAVVWNIVQDHDGYINVSSDENGTTFELYFPIVRDKVAVKDMPLSIEDYKGNGESVLVVDDEASQREITCNMLEVLGYKAESVSSGEEALAYLQNKSADIVLLDMIMDQGINGRETYERIIKIHPEQKAVIVSGYADTKEVNEAQRLGAGRYIKKPLTLKKLGPTVKEELSKTLEHR
ncbi:MAG: PAS domain S-box protein [Desulfobacteraceae bacterium]|jgi:PAS domain S-box-containing protein